MVPGARIELATPAFSGGALPLSYPGTCGLEIVWGVARLCQFERLSDPHHCADSSNSFIQVLPFSSTSRGRVPSGGPKVHAIFFHDVDQMGSAAIANA